MSNKIILGGLVILLILLITIYLHMQKNIDRQAGILCYNNETIRKLVNDCINNECKGTAIGDDLSRCIDYCFHLGCVEFTK